MRTDSTGAVALRAKLEATEELLSALVLELRAPLALIRVGATSLAEGQAPAAPSLDSARGGRAMLRAVTQIGAAVDRLVARGPQHARACEPTSGALDLASMLADIDDLQPIGRARGVELRVTACSVVESIVLDCDGLRAGRALANFVTGAVQSADSGAIVTVTATYDGAAVELVVHDEGSVVAAQASRRIWHAPKAVATLKSSPALGLHVVKEITESLGGEILVESTPSSGTTFRIRFRCSRVSENRLLATRSA